MPIETASTGSMMITGQSIDTFRLLSLKHALKLEAHGIKVRRGFSALKAVKEEFGFKGNREKVTAQFLAHVDQLLANRDHSK